MSINNGDMPMATIEQQGNFRFQALKKVNDLEHENRILKELIESVKNIQSSWDKAMKELDK
jgi:cell shape-determining protein MreC